MMADLRAETFLYGIAFIITHDPADAKRTESNPKRTNPNGHFLQYIPFLHISSVQPDYIMLK